MKKRLSVLALTLLFALPLAAAPAMSDDPRLSIRERLSKFVTKIVKVISFGDGLTPPKP